MAEDGAALDEIERVYRERGQDFFRLAYATVGDVDAARDAVQEGFARAVRSRRSYRGAGILDAWIGRCVLNAARDEIRRGRPPETTGADPDVAEAAPAEAVVRAVLRELPQRQREALFLRFYLGLDYAAIAEALGIAVGTVSATLHAARAALAEHLQEVLR